MTRPGSSGGTVEGTTTRPGPGHRRAWMVGATVWLAAGPAAAQSLSVDLGQGGASPARSSGWCCWSRS